MSSVHGVRRGAFWTALMGLFAVAAIALPASASAALCPVTPGVEVTAWIGGDGDFGNDLNWTNGTPSGSCDAVVTPANSPTITMGGGAAMKSLTLGGVGSTPTLVISAQSPNTILHATTTGIDIAPGASIVLTCAPQPTGCLGGAGGGSALNVGSSTIDNEGTITVDANSGTGASLAGAIDNTGTININQDASHTSGLLLNQGDVNIADGKLFKSVTESCGSTGTVFRNDAGGTLNAAGTGGLSVINFEQGDGDTLGTNPVRIPCGTLKYTGDGPSTARATGGFALSGEMRAGQSLTVSDESSNTGATLTGAFTNKGSITLTCPTTGACGADLNAAGNVFTNAGALTIPVTGGTSSEVSSGSGGTIVNTGTMNFEQSAFLGGVIVNKGSLNVADGKTVTNSGSSCGDTGAQVKNDTGGSVNGAGSGRLNVFHYEQGDGITSGDAPVQIPCGSVKYTGNGASKVVANGGFTLSGEMQPGQELILNQTTATLAGAFTGKGSITLTCLSSCGGGSTFNAAGNVFTNAGTLTVAAASGNDPSVSSGGGGTILNTGTMRYDQTGWLSGVAVNKGVLEIADGKQAKSYGSSCGDTGAQFKNDSGGSVKGIGSGHLSVFNYEQGNGTTSGTAPVQIPCGSLKYTGGGASTVQLNGGIGITGDISAGQTLRIVNGGSNAPPFTNAGTIVFDPNGSGPHLNVGTLTNTGRISGVGTVNGSLDNTTGTVAPGTSPGTLTVNNAYTQGAGGSLEIEVEGTGAGQFDKLAVNGNVTLGGTLALKPSAAYAAAATVGDSVGFLTYGGARTAVFAQTTSNPSLACPKLFGAAYNDGPKNVSAVVSGNGSCPPPDTPPQPPANPQQPSTPKDEGPGPVPDTILKSHPAAIVKTRKQKAKVSFSFSSDQAGATFQCKLDKEAYKPCGSPQAYKVKPGQHKFSVRAIRGGDGAADPTPAGFSFKVKKLPKKK